MEKQRIEAVYYLDVTGELYKAIDALRAWESLEPKQFPPHNLLGVAYGYLGKGELPIELQPVGRGRDTRVLRCHRSENLCRI